MDTGLIAASCSWPGRAGSLSQAGRGARPLKVVVGGASTARPLRVHRRAPVRLQRRARRRGEAMERDGLRRRGRGEEREAAEREWSLGEFQPGSLHPAGPFGELGSRRAGLRGRGRPRAAQVCPGAPRGLRGSCPRPAHSPPGSGGTEKPTSLARLRSTFLITWAVILPPYKGL